MAAQNLALDSFWVDKSKYDEAERQYYERLGHETLTPLAAEVAKARQRIIEMKQKVEEGVAVVGDGLALSTVDKKDSGKGVVETKPKEMQSPKDKPIDQPQPAKSQPVIDVVDAQKEINVSPCNMSSVDTGAIKFLEKKITEFQNVITKVQSQLESMEKRLCSIEKSLGNKVAGVAVCPRPTPVCSKPTPPAKDDDDDVDLFGSESEDDEAADKIREERLAAYNAKKSQKPVLIAKSSIVLDVKPWDDTTDMKAMEVEVRKITCDGLLWGASKLVPVGYGINKLQISCVVVDDKVSIDWLQEQIESNEEIVQSVDIAAFNKI